MSPLRDGDDRVTVAEPHRHTRAADAPHILPEATLPNGRVLPGVFRGRAPSAICDVGDRARRTARPMAAYGSDGSTP
ncbi:hypothetical protein [Streptomyces similanensis]|uniref:Uncharacterized protein n=1 Tax=Streptomyces similanensis TaxID=1274988 RepID=A0ABP9K2N5_9ACTN